MRLSLDSRYKSASQQIRVSSEDWVRRHAFCPSCKESLDKAPNNSKALDFTCSSCFLPFELKSKKGTFGRTVPDGAFRPMMDKVNSGNHPNFFLLGYGANLIVENFVLIPKRFIVPEMVQERKPLGPHARRAGWVGCNLQFSLVPPDGMIYYIRAGQAADPALVCGQWAKTNFLEQSDPTQRSWLVAVMGCVRKLGKSNFTLSELYEFELELQTLFPHNKHVRAKIRQQLQALRDQEWLTFLGHGSYRVRS